MPMRDDKYIEKKIEDFITSYLRMDIFGTVICCPYWMNKIEDGKVIIRGIYNGKGTASQIKRALHNHVASSPDKPHILSDPKMLSNFAKMEHIGIDCSGLAYRVLQELVRLKYPHCTVASLNDVFAQGIRRTNANTLTSAPHAMRIDDKTISYRLGDLIRINSSHHVAVILSSNEERLIYVHSSAVTAQAGVHKSSISITDANKSLSFQKWEEKTKTGDNFGKKYFHPDKGDGVYRLKIFT